MPLSATMTLSRGALTTSSSWCVRSIAKVVRSRALIPIGSASSAIARSSSRLVVGFDEGIQPVSLRLEHQASRRVVVEITEQEEDRVGTRLGGGTEVVLSA